MVTIKERCSDAKKDVDIVVYKGTKYERVPATSLFPPPNCLRQQQLSEEVLAQRRFSDGTAAEELFRSCYNSDADLMQRS